MQFSGINIKVTSFSANTMFELGEQISRYLENWNNNFFREDAYKPSYMKLVTVSHAVTVLKKPLPRSDKYTDAKRKKNTLICTPFTTDVTYSAIGVFEIVPVTKNDIIECQI